MTDYKGLTEQQKAAILKFSEELSKFAEKVHEVLKDMQPTIEKLNEAVTKSMKEDKSRRKFETVACKGHNRKEWWNR